MNQSFGLELGFLGTVPQFVNATGHNLLSFLKLELSTHRETFLAITDLVDL